jgi:ribosomal protein S18 acetylase RimI-like enzyme
VHPATPHYLRSTKRGYGPGRQDAALGRQSRHATVDDIRDLLALYCGFMRHEGVDPPDGSELRRRLTRLLTSEVDEVLIARSGNGAPVGYLQQRYYLSVWRPDRDAFIEDVFVVEDCRGRRVGERLVDEAFSCARRRGAARICLDCNERNVRGRRLYERLGFQNGNPAWEGAPQLYYSRLL